MRKRTKTILKVTGLLALFDITDIVAKGWMVAWLDLAHPDAAKDWREENVNTPAILKIRPRMINKSADFIRKLYTK